MMRASSGAGTSPKEYLHTLINPDHPDLGPKNNQVVFAWGRLKAGRSDFIRWFFSQSFGTVNLHGHTTVCQGSWSCKELCVRVCV